MKLNFREINPHDPEEARRRVEENPLMEAGLFVSAEKTFTSDIEILLGTTSATLKDVLVLDFANQLYGSLISLTFHGCTERDFESTFADARHNHSYSVIVEKKADEFKISIGYDGTTGSLRIDGEEVQFGQRHLATVSAMQFNAAVAGFFDDVVTRIVTLLDEIDGIEDHFRALPFFVACEGRWGSDGDLE